MLSAVESPSTQALRLTLARQLAEVLMRGVTGQVNIKSIRTYLFFFVIKVNWN